MLNYMRSFPLNDQSAILEKVRWILWCSFIARFYMLSNSVQAFLKTMVHFARQNICKQFLADINCLYWQVFAANLCLWFSASWSDGESQFWERSINFVCGEDPRYCSEKGVPCFPTEIIGVQGIWLKNRGKKGGVWVCGFCFSSCVMFIPIQGSITGYVTCSSVLRN